jgi:CheY-like chemotaxis protein/transcriptional regulator with PAS, ATPase and Fis domain
MKKKQLKPVSVVLTCLAIFLCMLFLARVNTKYFEKTIVTQTQNQLSTIADSEAENTESYFRDLQNKLQMLSKDPRVQKVILNYNTKRDDTRAESDSPVETLFEQLSVEIDNLYRLDAKGIVQNREPFKKDRVGIDFSQKPGVKNVIENQKPFISDIFKANSGRLCLSACYPVFHKEKLIGILRTIVYLDKIHEMLEHVGISQDSYAWIIDDHGHIISHRDKNFVGKKISEISQEINGNKKEESIVISQMQAGIAGSASLVFDEFSPDKMIISWSPSNLGMHTWSVAACTNYDQISGLIKANARNMFVIVACFMSILTAAGIAYYGVSRKKAQFEAHTAIGRVNEELQMISAERETMRDNLQKKKELFKQLISNISERVFWKDTNSTYQGCNMMFAKDAGLASPKDILGKTDHDLSWSKEQADFFIKCDSEVIRSSIPLFNIEHQEPQIDGSLKTILTNKIPLKNDNGQIIGVLGFYSGTKGLKTTQDKSVSKPGLFEMISNMDEGVVAADASGKIKEVNTFFTTLFNKTREQMLEGSIFDCLGSGSVKQVESIIEDFRKDSGSKTNVFQQTIGKSNYEIRLQPIYMEDDYAGVVLNMIDISKFTKTIEEIEQTIAKVSHQMRTPMNSIIGFIDLLMQEDITDEQKGFVNTLQMNSKSLLEIIDDNLESPQNYSTVPAPDATPEKEKPEVPNPQEPPLEKPEEAASGADKDANILLVDDVEENRMLIEIMLQKTNYNFSKCCNGQEAVELAGKEKFDLILMDIRMPVMDGLEATKQIRSEGMNRTTIIVAMTASTVKGDELMCLEAGCDDFLSKPIEKNILLRKIGRFVQQSKQINAAIQGEQITSFLSDNPDYQKMIEMFVNNLPKRVEEMQEALNDSNLQDLAFKVHALKGLGGFAGFPIYTEKAKILEQMICDNQIDKIQEQLDEMVKLCRKTKLIGPQTGS